MFKRLIIPLDGSRLSEAVLPTAVYLAQKLQAAITLVHVIERNAPKQVHGEPHLSKPDEAELYIAGVRQRLIPSGIPVEMHVHTVAIADVAQSIVDHAREFESDLVMMCTHGQSGLRKLFFGSIAQQVVALKVPVLLVRPGESGRAPIPTGKPFLVPLDGTELREAALPIAAALAKACGAHLKLLMVVPTYQTLSGVETTSRILLPATTQEMLALAYEDAGKYATAWISRLGAEGIEVSAELRRGDATEIIAKEAQHLDVDLIVMGTAARAGMDAFWSGSVAPKVSDRTHLPLLLIPAQE
ncbi:MAG: universal stress protein [Verrucomicrobia bacterium]|nr:universal stress protein [Verrucomicrobiota bacterium]